MRNRRERRGGGGGGGGGGGKCDLRSGGLGKTK